MSEEPIVVEFTSPDYMYQKHYFIGKSLEDILADTNNGKEFGFAKFSSYRVISLDEAEKLSLGLYDKGYQAVIDGCKSFKLQTPRRK